MDTIPIASTESLSAQTAVLATLRRDGPQTFESLILQCGLEWAPVFGAVDSLSRSGMVRLRRIDGNRYLVSFSGNPS